MMYIPVLLSAAIVEELKLICVVGGVLICFCFHVVADVSMVSMTNRNNGIIPLLIPT